MKERSKPRRTTAFVSILGTTQLHMRNPLIIAWWSAAFPGFGHLLLSKYLRGYMLIAWEMVINTQAKINLSMVYSFTGQFEQAKAVMDLRWMSLYVPVYLFAIYDSYRTTIDLNHMYALSSRENAPFGVYTISGLEINYLDKRTPWLALVWSMLMPGMGQLYIHRILTAFYILLAWVSVSYQCRLLNAIHFTLLGDFPNAIAVLDIQWLMYIPSLYGFAAYDAYINTVENNKLFDKEQAYFLKKDYQHPTFRFPS